MKVSGSGEMRARRQHDAADTDSPQLSSKHVTWGLARVPEYLGAELTLISQRNIPTSPLITALFDTQIEELQAEAREIDRVLSLLTARRKLLVLGLLASGQDQA